MKRLILSSVAAATLAGGMAMSFAAPALAGTTTPTTTPPNPNTCVPYATNSPIGTSGPTSTGVSICITPNPSPVLPSGGSLTVSGDPTTQQGYIIAQGYDGNPGALQGYIGIDSNEGVVGCNKGAYGAKDSTGKGQDHVIVDPNNPAAVSPTDAISGTCSAVPTGPPS